MTQADARWYRAPTAPLAVGCRVPSRPAVLRTVVEFDDEQFAEIRSRCVEQKTSFAEQVRILVTWALEGYDRK